MQAIKSLLTVLIIFCSFTAIAQEETVEDVKGPVGTTPRSIDIPEGNRGAIIGPSTGAMRDGVVAPTFSKKTELTANLSAGLGYSCGNFDPFNNVEQMLNNAERKVKQLPQQFVLAFEQAILSSPAYLLNKINPTLYNVITKNLDEAFELFEAEYKTCAQIEREVQLGNNPYGQLFKASVSRNQALIIGDEGIAIDEAMVQVRTEGAKAGVLMAGGETFGGEGQEPIDIHTNLVQAGSNILVGRDVLNTGSFAVDAKHPLTQYFESPEQIAQYVVDVYGTTKYDLTNERKTTTIPGVGYQHDYVVLRNQQIGILREFVAGRVERQEYEDRAQAQIAPELLKHIRRLDITARDIAIDDYARDIAAKKVLIKLDFINQAISTALKEPNIATSEGYQVIEAQARKLQNQIQRDIAHLTNARYQ